MGDAWRGKGVGRAPDRGDDVLGAGVARALLALRSTHVNVDLVQQVLAALERERVEYVVFGAVALALHGLPRATEDLDLFIAPNRDNVERLKTALRSVFQDPHIDEISADDLLGEYPAVQYGPPEGPFHIDILTRLGEKFARTRVAAGRLRRSRRLGGYPIDVASHET